MLTIDLNADLGEGGAQDAALMAMVSSVNIACGGHAGNQETMRAAVDAAQAADVAIGAHPGYEDAAYFGRRNLSHPPSVIAAQIQRQLERLLAICPHIHHVKPHGALYHQANEDPVIAASVAQTIRQVLPGVMLYTPPTGELANAGMAAGLAICTEGFIDRHYLPNGNLCPRSEPGALIEDPDEAVAQALQLALHGQATDITGKHIPLAARTLCVHGDSPNALALLKRVHDAFRKEGITIKAC